jgi:hypothetical protein
MNGIAKVEIFSYCNYEFRQVVTTSERIGVLDIKKVIIRLGEKRITKVQKANVSNISNLNRLIYREYSFLLNAPQCM